MAGNSSLGAAKDAKNDEFYTQLTDIEKELRHYRKHFKDKTVLCNCDDPFESNFFKYFVLNFNRLGLKKLIATCYATSPIAWQQLSLFDVVGGDEEQRNKPYKAVVTKVYDVTGDGGVDMFDVAELFKSHENELAELEGDGDFRSRECMGLLEEADIVVTNPPFSLFRQYVSTLVDFKKDFVIIGPDKGRKYKETFPLIRDNKMWLGATNPKRFYVPDSYQSDSVKVDDDGRRYMQMGNICWYTNLDIKKRHEELILFQRYASEKYPSYTNFDGIDVAHVSDSATMPVPWACRLTFSIATTRSSSRLSGWAKAIWPRKSELRETKEVVQTLRYAMTVPIGDRLLASSSATNIQKNRRRCSSNAY